MVRTILASGSRCPRKRRPTAKATRRPRGAPRLLALEAARTLFARQDYRSTTTKEIAEAAGVAEHLLFRHFGSKAALFNEAVVVPFLEIVDDLSGRWESIVPGPGRPRRSVREFLGALYDLFVENRGLVMTLWGADAPDRGGAGRDRHRRHRPGHRRPRPNSAAKGRDILGIDADHQDLAARSTVAMVAGMAAFGATFFGGTRPPRDVIVEEITQATLHGFLHRHLKQPCIIGTPRSATVTGRSSELSRPGGCVDDERARR